MGCEQCLLYYCIERSSGAKDRKGRGAGVFKESKGVNGIDLISVE